MVATPVRCRLCNAAVLAFTLDDGTMITIERASVKAVTLESGAETIPVRLVHDEVCKGRVK